MVRKRKMLRERHLKASYGSIEQLMQFFLSPSLGLMTKIDAYYIPDADLEQYLAEREELRKAALTFYERHFTEVGMMFRGSQDGEAVVALDDQGDIAALIHLDPYSVEAYFAAKEEGEDAVSRLFLGKADI